MRMVVAAAGVVLALGSVAVPSVGAAETAPALEPAAMIALADADPKRSHKGFYRMTVKSAAKPSTITFLNSSPDYRSAGDVTFSLSPAVGAALSKRLGKPAHEALLGRIVTVRGVLVRAPIVNTLNQRARSFNRWSYQVRIENLAQIEKIEG